MFQGYRCWLAATLHLSDSNPPHLFFLCMGILLSISLIATLLSLSLSYPSSLFFGTHERLERADSWPWNNFPLFILSLFCFYTLWLLTTGFLLRRNFFSLSPFYFRSIFLFKVFIHFDFILHSSLFLIFFSPPSPSLFSPAAPCNANTTCSEGKWIIEAAAAIPSAQKWAAEEGRMEGREERGWINEMERIDLYRRRGGRCSGCEESEKCGFVYNVSAFLTAGWKRCKNVIRDDDLSGI